MTAPKQAGSAVGMDTHAERAQEIGAADRPASAGDLVPGGDDERLDGLLPLGISPLAKGVRGRPAGAQNRRTAEMADYIVRRYGDPFEASAAIGGMSLKDAARLMREIASDVGLKLGASVMDIAQFQQACRRDVLPYIHAKRAAEDGKGQPVLPMVGIGVFERTDAGGVAFKGRSIEDAQYQDVTPGSAERSDGEGSDGEPSD